MANKPAFTGLGDTAAEVARALSENVSATRELTKQTQARAQQEQKQGAGGTGGTGAGAPDAEKKARGGLFKTFTDIATAGLALQSALKQVLGSFKAFATAVNDTTLSVSTRGRRGAEGLPLVGGFARDINEASDAARGFTDRLKQAEQQTKSLLDIQGVRGAGLRERDAIATERAGLAAGARATRLPFQVIPFQGLPRGTVLAEQQFERAVGLQPLLAAQRQAQQEQLAAREAAGGLAGRVSAQELAVARARGGLTNARRAVEGTEEAIQNRVQRDPGALNAFLFGGRFAQRPGGPGAKELDVRLQEQLAAAQRQQNQLVQEQTRLQELLNQKKKAEGEVVEANRKVAEAQLNLDKERLSFVRQQEDLLKGQARSFGSLTGAEQVAALQAARRAQQFGFGALSQEELSFLERAGAREFVGLGREQAALASDHFREFQALTGGRADLGEVQRERARLEARVAVQVQFNEDQLKLQLQNALDSLLRKLDEVVTQRVQASVLAITINVQRQNAAQK